MNHSELTDFVDCVLMVSEYFNHDDQKTKMWFAANNPNLGDISPTDMAAYRVSRLRNWINRQLDMNKGLPQ